MRQDFYPLAGGLSPLDVGFAGTEGMLQGNVADRTALSQGRQAIWKVWAHSANGFVVSRNRPNASKDGIACKLMEICSASLLSERR